MNNFKFNFLSQGQLGSLSIDNFLNFYFYSKYYHAISTFLVTLFLHLLLELSAEIVLSDHNNLSQDLLFPV